MKVDMSPEAVTQRLRTMDDLWLLSIKLMNTKRVKGAEPVEKCLLSTHGKAEIGGPAQPPEADLSVPPAVAGG